MRYDKKARDDAERRFVEEGQSAPKISSDTGIPLVTLYRWKKAGNWDADKNLRITGKVSLARELELKYANKIQESLDNNSITDPKTADSLAKLLKIIKDLRPEREMLSNIYALLKDLTVFVKHLGDDEFSKKFQKYLPEMADHLRVKYNGRN